MSENEQGFRVRHDRFSLTDPYEYRVTGWQPQDTELAAEADGAPVRFERTELQDFYDDRYGGKEVLLVFRFTEEDRIANSFKIYTVRGNERQLSFITTAKELQEKRSRISYYIDEFSMSREQNSVRIAGWAVSVSPVQVAVRDGNGKEVPFMLEKVPRLDVGDLFTECPIEETCGFEIETRGIPGSGLTVIFSCGTETAEWKMETSALRIRIRKGRELAKKGFRYLRYNGPQAFLAKVKERSVREETKSVSYEEWIKKHMPSEGELKRQRNTRFSSTPLISIVVPLYRTPEQFLDQLIYSVHMQTYGNWELVLSDGSGEDSPLTGYLNTLAGDPKIRVLPAGKRLRIAENTNAAIAAATGDYIAFADHDDMLAENALFEIVKLINAHPDAELIYTDEDKLVNGRYAEPNMKPDYDPDYLRSVNYICHLLTVKKTLAEKAGEIDPSMEGAQDYDFILRCTEITDRIYHIPKVLYHWRSWEESTAENPDSKRYAFEAGIRALNAHYRRLGWPASVEHGIADGIYRTSYFWQEKPLVTVLIPNKDHIPDLKKCISSLLEYTEWPNLEILVIENNSTEETTWDGYKEIMEEYPCVRLMTYKGPFNYSAINNAGVKEARGEYVLLLNNDTEALSDVITELMGFCLRSDVGAAGARLYFSDDTIQHAGVVLGWGGVAGHAFANEKRGTEKYKGRIACQQDYSAVTAACMMVRKSVFEEVGGFYEGLAVAFNDIDLCMKIRKAGYLIAYNPYAEMYHYESKSRGLENTPEKKRRFRDEVNIFRKRWGKVIDAGDPYYSPNLSMVTPDFSLKHI